MPKVIEINKVTTIPDRLFITLEEAIIEGKIALGSKISEPELANKYNVSRGALREALARLENCHLIARKANLGARVVSLSLEQLIEIYHVREALEGMAAKQAAKAISHDELTNLKKMLVQHKQEINVNKGHSYYQKKGDFDFHYQIVMASHNGHLINLLCKDLYYLVRLYRYQFGMPSKRTVKAFSEHELIIDAIEDGDAETAEFLMRLHIRTSRKNVENIFKDNIVNEK